LLFLDISATNEKRKTLSALARQVASNINIPFTVGGGINSIEDVTLLLNSGADKISINSAAVKNPELISHISKNFGNQCVVIAIDAKTINNSAKVFLNGGKTPTNKNALDWAMEAADRGAGEILLTSMDRDGTKTGFDLSLTKQISTSVKIPVIASGGAGKMEDFLDIFEKGFADAALAAGVFHFKEIEIQKLKRYLKTNNIIMRL
jgi:cyclase